MVQLLSTPLSFHRIVNLLRINYKVNTYLRGYQIDLKIEKITIGKRRR